MNQDESRHTLTNISIALAGSQAAEFFDPIPDLPLERADYNWRGLIVASAIGFVRRHFPTVFWNEIALARRVAQRGFPEVPVERAPPL